MKALQEREMDIMQREVAEASKLAQVYYQVDCVNLAG
jgi:hypothetical protein